MRTVRDIRGMPLRVERSADGELVVQTFLCSTCVLGRAGVRTLLDVIASSPAFRNEMRKALAVYEMRADRSLTRGP